MKSFSIITAITLATCLLDCFVFGTPISSAIEINKNITGYTIQVWQKSTQDDSSEKKIDSIKNGDSYKLACEPGFKYFFKRRASSDALKIKADKQGMTIITRLNDSSKPFSTDMITYGEGITTIKLGMFADYKVTIDKKCAAKEQEYLKQIALDAAQAEKLAAVQAAKNAAIDAQWVLFQERVNAEGVAAYEAKERAGRVAQDAADFANCLAKRKADAADAKAALEKKNTAKIGKVPVIVEPIVESLTPPVEKILELAADQTPPPPSYEEVMAIKRAEEAALLNKTFPSVQQNYFTRCKYLTSPLAKALESTQKSHYTYSQKPNDKDARNAYTDDVVKLCTAGDSRFVDIAKEFKKFLPLVDVLDADTRKWYDLEAGNLENIQAASTFLKEKNKEDTDARTKYPLKLGTGREVRTQTQEALLAATDAYYNLVSTYINGLGN